jgi:hypothetical protein
MIFIICQQLGGYVWCTVVRNLIVERWQTIFSNPSTLRYHNHFGTLCITMPLIDLQTSPRLKQIFVFTEELKTRFKSRYKLKIFSLIEKTVLGIMFLSYSNFRWHSKCG